MRRQDRHRLGVGVGAEGIAEPFELAPQGLEILNDAIVHDGNPVGGDRMGVGLGRQAVGRPAGMPNADHPLHGFAVEPPGEVDELAFGASALDPAVDQGGDAGRIIAAVFETAQPLQQPRCNRILGDDADNPAHQFFLRNRARISSARPGLSTCWPRAIVSASGGTSRTTTLPAATIAPSPTATGATSAVFEPMKTPSPIIVWCLLT